MCESSEQWESRMSAAMVAHGPRAWLDEARLERARRIAAEARIASADPTPTVRELAAQVEDLRRQLAASEDSELRRGRYMENLMHERRRLRDEIWTRTGCDGKRSEQCDECDWVDNELCAVDLKLAWGGE